MKPYKLFLLTSALFSITVLTIDLIAEKNTIDINVHDTYFIIAKFHIWALLTLFLGMLTCVYFILHKMNRKTNNILTYTHYFLTLLPIIAIPLFGKFAQTTPRRYYSATTSNVFDNGIPSIMTIYFILLIALGIGQLIFIVNILTSRKNYVS
jgi:heme/copper-type cytochrome/quinol oxidase subunit 1